jgi:hypothetical protein
LTISNISTDPNDGNIALTDLTLLTANIAGEDAADFQIIGFTPDTVLDQGDVFNLEVGYIVAEHQA